MPQVVEEDLTLAGVSTPMTVASIVFGDGLTVGNDVTRAFRSHQLIVAQAVSMHPFTRLEASHGYVLSEEHVESRIHVLERFITNENDAIEAFKNHANLRG